MSKAKDELLDLLDNLSRFASHFDASGSMIGDTMREVLRTGGVLRGSLESNAPVSKLLSSIDDFEGAFRVMSTAYAGSDRLHHTAMGPLSYKEFDEVIRRLDAMRDEIHGA